MNFTAESTERIHAKNAEKYTFFHSLRLSASSLRSPRFCIGFLEMPSHNSEFKI